ncbi:MULTISPECIES: hypothetical protein [unclassified Natrinema]|uniref:hypothetical protein n=1 Tax=unclassified Natrinema TaxID=2622230 RepID=UPI00026D5330|nr:MULTISPECIES: hypothetical protein [unclassified Natrinema]AFO58192.1 hypothetical protein NJ7G_2970 [Natrinema sp. J7-2]
MTDLRRRNALQLLGGGMAFLAGCSETSDGNGTGPDDADSTDSNDQTDTTDSIEGDLPSYASVLPTTERSAYFYGAIDVETMSTLLEDEGAEAGAEPTDPLVGNPVVVALLCSFGLQQLGTSAGRDAYTEHNETADGEEQFVYADGVYTLVGSYDRDGLATALEAAGYTAESEADAYAVYTHDESDEVVGVSAGVYAYSYPNGSESAFDPVAAVERTVATATGDRPPKHEVDDGFDRLLRAGENGGITSCLYTDADEFDAASLSSDRATDEDSLQFAFDAFEGANGVSQHLAVTDTDAAATASAVVTYRSEGRVDAGRLESSLGTEAETVEFTPVGSRIEIDATYGGEFARE